MDDYQTIRFILENLNNTRGVINEVIKIKNKLIDLVLSKKLREIDFYKMTSLLTPQSRSPLWEKYFIKKHGAKKVGKNENKGDLFLKGKYYEYKVSGYNLGDKFHLVQIRIWQGCDYIFQHPSDDTIKTFILSHENMVKEMRLCRSTSAHGTRKANKDNKNVENRITLTVGDENWKRWIKLYSNIKL